MTTTATVTVGNSPRRVGGWLPANSHVLINWVTKLINSPKSALPWPQEVKNFQHLIEQSAELRMLASAMFDEVPNKPPYNKDPNNTGQIRSYQHMLSLIAHIMREVAPEWSQTEYDSGLIGFPFNAILDWPMATPSGYAFFLNPKVNAQFKIILNKWRDTVLATSKSQIVLNKGPEGWLSEAALKTIAADTNVPGRPDHSFEYLFDCDTTDPHYGFGSWDAFFTRTFRNINVDRPVEEVGNPSWIVNSCESKPFALQDNVRKFDAFWLKGQPYSVAEMTKLDELTVDKFVGGTVYQAFLSATSYHRWHSPVKGKVVYADVIDGTYFSEPTITGFTNPGGPDPAGPDRSQGYITHVATRAVYLIDAGDPVGLVCAIYVGMADVSTCEIGEKFDKEELKRIPHTSNQGVDVNKGDEIGMFHHGGSTHCLIFGKDVKLQFVPQAFPETATRNLPLRSKLAYVEPRLLPF